MNNATNGLLEQLIRLEWLLRYRHMRMHRQRGPMGDPYRGQGRILALLKLKPEIGQKELASILDIRSQSLGELLAKLERQRYITRTPSETDHRSMEISLTEAGKAASEEEPEAVDADALFGCLSEEEQSRMGDYLGRLIASWETSLEAEVTEGFQHRGHGRGGRGHGPQFGRPGFAGGRGPEGRMQRR